MPRKSKKDAVLPQTIEQSSEMLHRRADESGIARYLEKYADQWKPYEEKARAIFLEEAGAHHNKVDEDFVVYRELVAQVVKRHLYWFLRWMTPQEERDRIERVHFVICDFLERGLAAIPDEWRAVGEFYDRRRFIERTGCADLLGVPYLIDVTPQIILMPRGLGKSHGFTILDAARQPGISPSSKWFIGAGTLPLAQQLMSPIKRVLETPFLSLIMPDVYCSTKQEYLSRGGRWTTNLVDIVQMDTEFNFRQENTFTAVSLGSATTGSHPNGGFYDDLDNEESTKTAAAADKTERFWRNQSALANRPAQFFQRATDTFWYEDGTMQRCKMESTYFRMPSDWWHEGERKVLSHFYIPYELLQEQKKKWKEFGDAHACIAPVPRDGSRLEVGFRKDKHVKVISPQELEQLKAECVVVSVGDPAYTDKNKRVGDAKSRATIVHFVRAEGGWTGVFDVWQTGGLDIDRWRERAVHEATEKKSDIWIQDCQGTQFGHFENAARAIREATENRCKTVMHRKPLGNKMAVANEILKDLFAGGEIMVLLLNEGDQAKRMQAVIDQLCGLNMGMDIVDCIVYAIDDVDLQKDYRTAMLRRKLAAQRKAVGKQKQPGVLVRKFAMNRDSNKDTLPRW